ncbi:PA0069 family radical SAM protein [Litoreibacter arenae]|uniref:Radical SAM domain protein n=1 Tax=Litoreibacter arenae DSM 19593 TaxID=1123360 RepID=S9QCN3_9RHOB|nr:PA0069 family radical SAM protein [Litoreibacter arenae]EPX79171.1 Radical SAM domain protein [Litoreibacter arenae DSM 19593]
MEKNAATAKGSERLTGRVRGRGASENKVGRFEAVAREVVDDGWGIPDDEVPLRRTQVACETITKVVTRNTSPDISFDRSLNPYRGCEHGCIYCFARPSHAYLGLSPGLDFETRLIARPNAAEALERELRRPSYRAQVLAIGTNTDAYQPIEKDRRIMRAVLAVLQRFRHPVAIVTKGSLIERDIDILGEMAAAKLASLAVSVTTLDAKLSRQMEPRVPSPARRLKTIERLAEAGIPVRVSASPMIPGLTDHELEAILQQARNAGAVGASTISLRLPREVSELFQDWLAREVPGSAEKVMGRVRQMHGGRDYDPRFGHRMRGEGVHADLMRRRFEAACKRFGLTEHLPSLRTDLFTVPAQAGDQLSLF